MELLSIVLVAVGFGSLFAGWLLTRPSHVLREADIRKCRGIISKIEKQRGVCTLTVSFSSPDGTILQHQTATSMEDCYEGMSLLILFRYKNKELEVLQMQTFMEAYGKAFIFLMAGILLIVCGATLL